MSAVGVRRDSLADAGDGVGPKRAEGLADDRGLRHADLETGDQRGDARAGDGAGGAGDGDGAAQGGVGNVTTLAKATPPRGSGTTLLPETATLAPPRAVPLTGGA